MLSPEADCFNMVGIANMMAAQPRIHTVSFVTDANSATSTIVIPSSATAAAGDIAILWDRATNSVATAPAAVTPSGFTQAVTTIVQNTIAMRSSINYKVLEDADLGSTITGMAALGTGVTSKLISVFRPIYRSSVLQYIPTAFNGAATNSGTSVATQTVSASTIFNNNPAIVLAQYTSTNNSIAAATKTFTSPMTSFSNNSGTSHYVRYAIALLGTNFANNTTVALSSTPNGSRLILQSGILTIR